MPRDMGYRSSDFDGVLCFGAQDWWIDGPWHHDAGLMRALVEAGLPVLFINPIGTGQPTVRRSPYRRGAQRLRHMLHGPLEVAPRLHVLTLRAIVNPLKGGISAARMSDQISRALATCGISRPLLWIADAAAADLLEDIDAAVVVLHRAAPAEAHPDCDPLMTATRLLKARAMADLVVYGSEHLAREDAGHDRRQYVLTPGVDLEASVEAAARHVVPPDLARIRGPRIGYVGAVDPLMLDMRLIEQAAGLMLDCAFCLVGPSSLRPGWTGRSNVFTIDRDPAASRTADIAAMDVLIWPWQRNTWTAGSYPLAIKDGLASGRQIVATDIPAIEPWSDLVYAADQPHAFAASIRHALRNPVRSRRELRTRLSGDTWADKATRLLDTVFDLTPARLAA